MDILSELGLDPESFALGSLCKRGHDFEGTGKSLRYIVKSGRYAGRPGTCVECKDCKWKQWKRDNPKRYQENNKRYYWQKREEQLKSSRQYYQEHRKERIAYAAEWEKRLRTENPEKYRKSCQVRNKNYRLRHGEKALEVRRERYRIKGWKYSRDHYLANREAILRRQAEYQRRDKDGRKIRAARRRAKKEGNHSYCYTPSQLKARQLEFEGLCAYCQQNTCEHWDHFIPINRGGADAIGNLLPCCQSCNTSKLANDPKEWFERQSFYSKRRWREILRVLGKTSDNYQQIPLF